MIKTPSAKLGARVRELRGKRRLTQAALARAAEIDPADLSRIENGHGERGPSLDIVYRLAAGLGVPPSRLLES